jgi:hypothetical protein
VCSCDVHRVHRVQSAADVDANTAEDSSNAILELGRETSRSKGTNTARSRGPNTARCPTARSMATPLTELGRLVVVNHKSALMLPDSPRLARDGGLRQSLRRGTLLVKVPGLSSAPSATDLAVEQLGRDLILRQRAPDFATPAQEGTHFGTDDDPNEHSLPGVSARYVGRDGLAAKLSLNLSTVLAGKDKDSDSDGHRPGGSDASGTGSGSEGVASVGSTLVINTARRRSLIRPLPVPVTNSGAELSEEVLELAWGGTPLPRPATSGNINEMFDFHSLNSRPTLTVSRPAPLVPVGATGTGTGKLRRVLGAASDIDADIQEMSLSMEVVDAARR